ncbi:PalH/RIM21-domain-containing protein [Microdochium trichocladiopsis]|uniref:PalH/RIM21-domain-containing protein n=1 Tax=Microdochium trichocladiopsis TaxID=1682393 RepID=A0A9P8YE44_9PEZI|nr:PalH/RIM21-domain-containing protein [Microdochium trichocladiopsis]KAH7037775.1 PalH/RIM21-domain-containing protein [Microdochium trichocladiopsis]
MNLDMATAITTTVAAATPAFPAGVLAACTPLILPAHGVLSVWGAEPTVLAYDAVFEPECLLQRDAIPEAALSVSTSAEAMQVGNTESDTEIIGHDEFNASIFPQCYALAATTVLAYVLFIMLLIVPRSFLDGGIVILGRRGFTNGPSHGISIGGRPWLQKIAALSVTISLTIATVDTFRVAERQYRQGMQDASELQAEVLGGVQLKVIQLVSDTFLWLAQAQTLIRLFPRQREKIIIKWTAFSLITLDIVFGALNSFKYVGIGYAARPLNFTEPVAALSYLFQLSLGLLYAAWVIYYALMKKRYAFYHPLMKNISLMAVLSIFSLLVPVVFFVLDIAKPDFTGWGEYVRWVGAAAASVVVWEWVERIEALEREEKKDGILGREVFDGDELMDSTPSDLHSWHRRKKTSRKGSKPGGDGGEGGMGNSTSFSTPSATPSRTWPAMSAIANRSAANIAGPRHQVTASEAQQGRNVSSRPKPSKGRFLNAPFWPSRPAPAVTPVSRTDTASADSTVYAVRYQPLTETSSGVAPHDQPFSVGDTASSPIGINTTERSESSPSPPNNDHVAPLNTGEMDSDEPGPSGSSPWYSPRRLGLLRVASRGPPAEVLPHTTPRQSQNRRNHDGSGGRWDVRGRWEDFAANHAEKVMERMRGTPDIESLPVTVIPAPPRPGAALAQLLEEEGEANAQARAEGSSRAVPAPTLRGMASASSSIPLASLPPRNLSVSTASRPFPTPGESIGSSVPRSPVASEDRNARGGATPSRRPVVRYESLPVLPSNEAQRDELPISDAYRHPRTTLQHPPPP